ncbi:hypothetical protein KIW84_021957 [Lathyrus oleraceus]|uniref:Uncharacterized protein n=1 Tax=Pisum sativum TaxID=3888 RepID=A0A9D4YDT4_PEA|nr:hypothetical protein KIW84_021957 [Pisum sativum]
MDLDVIPKAWTYFLHHILDTNLSGSELIFMRALALYYLLNRRAMNVRHIIFANMDEIAQSVMKKSSGHASVILLLCMKEKVAELTDGCIVNLTQALDARWIVDHPRRTTRVKEDFCPHTGLLGRYLTHEVDVWAASQRFRDKFLGDPSTTFYARYQYPGMETPIQLGGPIQQQQYHQTLISAFLYHGDPTTMIRLNTPMTERDLGADED